MKKSVDGKVMEMVPIESKNLSYVGYSEENLAMAIEFCRGPVYIYNEVPKNIFEELLSSPSPDSYFDEKIKNGFKNKRVW